MISWLITGTLVAVGAAGVFRLARMDHQRQPAPAWGLPDIAALVGVVTAALFSIRPYLTGNLVGSGDSYFYGLQVADFVTQLRHGVLPVLAGQSAYAYNGNAQILRTAPYFPHLAGALDLATFRRLSFVQLQDLTVVLTALAAAVVAYVVARRLSGGRRLASALLAAIYVMSPAILAPLVIGDMFPTYLTAPWLLLGWCGIAGMLREADDTGPQLLAATALAALWYAHPPVAAWMSVVWAGAQLGRFLLAAGAPGQLRRQLGAGTLFAGLTAYVFIAVATLHLRPEAPPPPDFYVFTPDDVARAIRGAFTPFSTVGGMPDIQLGWTLWGVLLVGVGSLLRRQRLAGAFFATSCALFLLLLIPAWPWASSRLWLLIPDRLATLTTWPQQRLNPILAAAAVVAFALALHPRHRRRAWSYPAACGLLLLGAAWSFREAAALQRRIAAASVPAAAARARFDPGNIVLARYSYALFGRMPAYYTDGWTDPEFESRLLDANMEVSQDDAAAVLRAAPAGTPAAWTPLAPQTELNLSGPGDYLLAFAFQNPSATGEITVRGGGIDRVYRLPRSGGPLAFGSEAGCAKTTVLRLTGAGVQRIALRATVPGASVHLARFAESRLPVRIITQTPYTAEIHAAAGGFLETPRVWLDGYAATVNGRPAALRLSPNGLVAVTVPAGDATVVLTYVGPPILRWSWLLSLATLAGLPWLASAALRRLPPTAGSGGFDRAWIRQHNLPAGLARAPRRRVLLAGAITGVAVIVGGFAWVRHHRAFDRAAFGSLRLSVEIPRWSPQAAEPLVVTGRTGAADCIYVRYDNPHEIRLGWDHWSVGGPVSPPIRIDYGRPHVLELTLGSLYPQPGRAGPAYARLFGNPQAAPFRLVLDGQVVFDLTGPFYPAGADEVAVGRNPAGGSVAGASFSGRVLSVTRFLPAPAALAPAGSFPSR